MEFTSVAALAAFTSLLTPAVALAHHGWSGYSSTPQKITGVIRAVQFANPHATIELDAQGRSWLVVLAPPSRMNSRGLPRDARNGHRRGLRAPSQPERAAGGVDLAGRHATATTLTRD